MANTTAVSPLRTTVSPPGMVTALSRTSAPSTTPLGRPSFLSLTGSFSPTSSSMISAWPFPIAAMARGEPALARRVMALAHIMRGLMAWSTPSRRSKISA